MISRSHAVELLLFAPPAQASFTANVDIKMSACTDVTDYQWLIGSEAAGMLAELAVCREPLHTAVARLRRHFSAERTHLLVEQVELRRRAAAKFAAAERMFFTRTALEQATDEHIARYKAARFAEGAGARSPVTATGRPSHRSPSSQMFADLCCGIGGDLLALAEHGSVTAIDCDPVATLLAAANIRAVQAHADATFHTVDVNEFSLDAVSAWHIDPDRRAGGRRTTSLDASRPNLATIERLLEGVPHAAVKLAPATRVPTLWADVAAATELEWISRGGECRQLVAWHGDLAQAPGQHRATILPAACGLAPRTVTGTPNQPIAVTTQLNQYIFDIDPAVLAAHLKAAIAAEHDLNAFSRGPTYLTGPAPVSDPALQCFHIDEVLPLRVKPLAALLRDRRIGQLELKKRGVDIELEPFRQKLKLRGDNAATLLITPVAGRPTAVLAHRVS
jgi:hypothetical protein